MRKTMLMVAALVVPASVVGGAAQPAQAGPPPLVGTTTCAPTFTGAGAFSSKITATGGGTALKIRFRGSVPVGACAGPVSVAGVPQVIVRAYAIGAGQFVYQHGAGVSRCANFETLAPKDVVYNKITMTVTWALASGLVVAPSTVTYNGTGALANGKYSAALVGATMHLDLGTPLTHTAVAGSFAGSLVQNTVMVIAAPPPFVNCPVGPAFVFGAGSLRF